MPTYTDCSKCGVPIEGTIEFVGSGRKEEAKQSWDVLCDKCESEKPHA